MKKRYVWTIVTVLYVLFIYSNSLKPASVSSADSGSVLQTVKGFFVMSGISTQWLTEHIIRKMGHFSEYAGLGLLLLLCMKSYGFSVEKRWLLHFTAGYLIPFVDETIQLFVNGRSGQISDVWLDCSGVAFATVLMAFFNTLYKKTRKKNEKKLPNNTAI